MVGRGTLDGLRGGSGARFAADEADRPLNRESRP